MADRLGSVRANGAGERFSYYPYGEERGTSADGREKFGTYTRDSVGVDYGDQRYYGVGTGRFGSADPYMASGGAASPSTWNRYLYVHGDPVNFHDPTGNLEADPNGTAGGDCLHLSVDGVSYGCVGEGGSGTGVQGGGSGNPFACVGLFAGGWWQRRMLRATDLALGTTAARITNRQSAIPFTRTGSALTERTLPR